MDDKERIATLEEQVKILPELRTDIKALTAKVQDNSMANKIGKVILWLVTTTGVAYFLQYIKG